LRSDFGYLPPTMQRLAVTKQQKPHFCGFFMGKSIALFFEHRYNATPFSLHNWQKGKKRWV
jgi:hypothetical protein